MEQIKIVFFDVDGTLIDYKADGMSDKTVEMLKGLQANGIKICIASGRAPIQMPDIPGIKFDACSPFNISTVLSDIPSAL